MTTSSYDATDALSVRQFAGNGATMRVDYAYTGRGQVYSEIRHSDLAGTVRIGDSLYYYDADGNATGMVHRGPAYELLDQYDYTYDLAGRMTSRTFDAVTTTFSYDMVNQVLGDGTTTLIYDATGNRDKGASTYTTGNRLTTDGLWTFTYDAVGNITKKSKGASAETWTYSYDHNNQMTNASKYATDGGTYLGGVTYTYDVFGNRLSRLGTDTGEERYGYDGWDTAKANAIGAENFDAWADLDNTNALTMRRVYDAGFDNLGMRIDPAGTLTAWYLNDIQGSVTQAHDDTGVFIDWRRYDAFGNITDQKADYGSADRYAYVGREWDTFTGLQYNRARMYDPQIGRWYSADPMGFDAGDVNLYRYVGNGYVNATDPSGYAGIRDFIRKIPVVGPRLDAGLNFVGKKIAPAVNFFVPPAVVGQVQGAVAQIPGQVAGQVRALGNFGNENIRKMLYAFQHPFQTANGMLGIGWQGFGNGLNIFAQALNLNPVNVGLPPQFDQPGLMDNVYRRVRNAYVVSWLFGNNDPNVLFNYTLDGLDFIGAGATQIANIQLPGAAGLLLQAAAIKLSKLDGIGDFIRQKFAQEHIIPGNDSSKGIAVYFEGSELPNDMINQPPDQRFALTREFNNPVNGTGDPLRARDRLLYRVSIFPNSVETNINNAFTKIVAQQKQNPGSPVFLFGYSRGAVAALGVADKLKAAGIQVKFIGLLDPVASGGPEMLGQNLGIIPSNVQNAFVADKEVGVGDVGDAWFWLDNVFLPADDIIADTRNVPRVVHNQYPLHHDEFSDPTSQAAKDMWKNAQSTGY